METLQEVFDKWCNEMRKEAIKATFVKALYKAGLVDAAKLVASSSVSGSNQ